MRYFNEHRRKIIKQNYIRGTKATVSSDTSSVVLDNFFGVLRELKLQGKTEQKQYKGYNLFDKEKASIGSNWEGSIYKKFKGFTFKKGIHYTVTLKENNCNKSKYPFDTEIVAAVINSKTEWGGIFIGNSGGDYYKQKKFSVYSQTDDLYLVVYLTGDISYKKFFEDVLVGLQITEGSDIKPYEPYVGGTPSPNPNYPQDIVNLGNTTLESVVRGINLFDESLLLEGIYNYNPNDPRPKEPDVVKTDEGYEIFGNYVTYYGSNNPLLLHLKKTIKPDVEYTLVRNIKTVGTKTAGMISLYISGNPILSFGNGKSGKCAKTFKFSQEQIDNITHFYVYGTLLKDINDGASKTVFEYIQLVEGSYTEDTAPPYEPYIEQTTISMCENVLCGIDGFNDTLTLDFVGKKAIKTKKVLYEKVSELIEKYGATFDESGDDWAIYIRNIPPRKNIDYEPLTYYCTHFISYHKNDQLEAKTPQVEVAYDNSLWFYYPLQKSVDEFKQWCIDNDVRIAYVLDGEYSSEIYVELPKELPRADTLVLEVSDDNINGLDVVYYSYEKEDSYSLTVHYKDREGNTLLESKTNSVRHGSRYKVIAPEIEGYMPICAEYEGYMNKDMEIVITYSSI